MEAGVEGGSVPLQRRARSYGTHRLTASCGKNLGCYIGMYRWIWHERLHDCMFTHEITCIRHTPRANYGGTGLSDRHYLHAPWRPACHSCQGDAHLSRCSRPQTEDRADLQQIRLIQPNFDAIGRDCRSWREHYFSPHKPAWRNARRTPRKTSSNSGNSVSCADRRIFHNF